MITVYGFRNLFPYVFYGVKSEKNLSFLVYHKIDVGFVYVRSQYGYTVFKTIGDIISNVFRGETSRSIFNFCI